MRVVTARLIKRITADGVVEMRDEIPVGKTYRVDLDSRRVQTIYNLDSQRTWAGAAVRDIAGGWLPLELLDIDSLGGRTG